MIDAALKDAGVAPSQVQYLEAHGTGTTYGDPMEIGAAISVYGKGRKAAHVGKQDRRTNGDDFSAPNIT